MVEAVVVFGGSGFVGRNLIAHLAPSVGRLISVSKSGASVAGAGESYRMDALDKIPLLPPQTVVVNVAAHRYDAKRFDRAQSEILLANSELVETLYYFCLERGLTEVRAASSVAVYPAGLDRLDDAEPVDLNRLPNPNETFYGWSKRWGELLARLHADKYGISTLSFRISNVYGPLDSTDMSNAHVLPSFVMRALCPGATFEIKGDPDVERDFIFVSDVCRTFERSLALRGQTDAFNLCTGQTTSLRELATTILRLSGQSREIVVGATAVAGVKARCSSNSRLCEFLGSSSFVGLADGLIQTLDWYRDALAR